MSRVASLKDTDTAHNVDWRSPIFMFVCYIVAICCAVGHHVLNICLRGKAIEDLALDQQWVARTGNALAYLVKVLLVLSTGVAYCQCIWQHARRVPTKIGTFDTMFGVLDNIFELRHVRFWFRRPILILTVIIIWLLPLIAIITPGTLSVVSRATSQPTVITIQQREYGRGLYAAVITADNGTVFYGGARSYLKGPTMATLVETEILSAGRHPTNVTYSLDFFGPALTCSKAGSQVTEELTDLITQYQTMNGTTVVFDTWIPKPNATSNATLVDGTIVRDSEKSRDLRLLDQTSPDAAKIYYSIAPPPGTEAETGAPIYVIQCSLYNASWQLDFDLRSTGEQTLTPLIEFQNWMPGWSSMTAALQNSPDAGVILDYAGLMETFGAMTSGTVEVPNEANLPFVQTSAALEMSPILFADVTPSPFTEEAMVRLQRSLETTFQNMTLSARFAVLPQQELRGDTPLLTFSAVDATSTFSRNVYEYAPRDLIVAYTLGVVLSAVVLAFAMRAIRDMDAVYANNFSTAVRVTRSQTRLDHIIVNERDRSGAEPLPQRIADAYIWVAKEPKMGVGIGRGRVGTDASSETDTRPRRWWGKEKEMDLERAPEKAAVVTSKEIKSMPNGNWI